MYPTRQEVIEKLLNADSSEISTGASCRSSSSSSEASNQEISRAGRGSTLRQRQWTDSEQFIDDNLREVYEKLPNLEKQIWGKLIVMEGNRRTAKAYLRHPLITIDGSDVEFDGLRIGLSRFENTSRPSVIYEIFNDILSGVKLKIDPDGNIWAKRACYSPIYLKPLYRNRANDLFLIDQRPAKVFDIKRFKEVLVHELKQPSPDRRKLEKCCLVCLKFSLDHGDLMKTPCWIVMVHLVAIELLNLVMPKDNDMSSPSSSFTASPRPMSDFQEKARNLEKESSKRLYAKHHRDPNRSEKQNYTPWVHFQSPLSPNFDSMEASKNNRACSSSMVDLRFLPPGQVRNENENAWRHPHGPVIPRRPQMGITAAQRVFSMEALNKRHFFTPAGRAPFVPEPRMLAAQIERMQMQKWQSQDSGIASGSGSYGRK